MTDTMISTGPDLTRCGQILEWADRATLDQRFRDAAAQAIEMMEFDIELCRWSADDPIAGQYVGWWNNQRAMLRRYLRNTLDGNIEFVVHRRTDTGDGYVKGYVRIEAGETT